MTPRSSDYEIPLLVLKKGFLRPTGTECVYDILFALDWDIRGHAQKGNNYEIQ